MASKALCVILAIRIDCSLPHCKKKSHHLAVQDRYHQGKLSAFSDLVWERFEIAQWAPENNALSADFSGFANLDHQKATLC